MVQRGFLPPLIKKCLKSWHDIVPDYKIKLWTGDMIKNLDFKYLQDALKVKKYAFACDVVRAYALYTEGGIYMDSDVFLKRRFEEYLVHDFVSFVETYDVLNDKEVDEDYYENGMLSKAARTEIKRREMYGENAADKNPNNKYWHRRVSGIDISFMASVKGHPFLKAVLDVYRERPFIYEDGTSDSDKWIIGPYIYAKCAASFGFQIKNEDQLLDNDMMLFHRELYNNDKTSFAQHCCNHSWVNNYSSHYWIKNKIMRIIIGKGIDLARKILATFHLYSLCYPYLRYDKQENESR